MLKSFDFGKESDLEDQNHNPGRKWRAVENDGDGNRYFDNFRFTPYTTDLEFYKDPKIYETKDVPRTTQDRIKKSEDDAGRRPRGEQRSDERIKAEIKDLLSSLGELDSDEIQVDVNEGIVTLSGSVNSSYEKQTAERVTENVFSVLGVNNQLKINR